jgi:threonyl-tRNA synthetase
MADISVSLPSGESVRVPRLTTVAEALAGLVSGKQRKRMVAARAGDELFDLRQPLTGDVTLEPVVPESEAGLEVLRHSAAHIMAQAVRELFGEDVKVAIGPAIESGFYYDFQRRDAFTPDDFERIEAKMAEIAAAGASFVRSEMPSADAIALFSERQEPFKVELIQDLDTDTVSLFQVGDFLDLCRGPHLPDTAAIRHFKLLRVAGAYWRGDEKREMLQRLYGTAFYDAKGLAT